MKKVMAQIQKELKASKSQYNRFGKYNYRSCEDIVEAVKPLLFKHEVYLNISDEIVAIGSSVGEQRFYVKATASVIGEDGTVTASAYAREPLSQKGMNEAQITGSASSYARKYALNGLLAIDDTKDADTQDNREQMSPEPIDADKVNNAIAAFKEEIDKDELELGYERIQAGWERLTNDERIAVQEGMKIKAPDSNRMYKTLLADYLTYKPGVE